MVVCMVVGCGFESEKLLNFKGLWVCRACWEELMAQDDFIRDLNKIKESVSTLERKYKSNLLDWKNVKGDEE